MPNVTANTSHNNRTDKIGNPTNQAGEIKSLIEIGISREAQYFTYLIIRITGIFNKEIKK